MVQKEVVSEMAYISLYDKQAICSFNYAKSISRFTIGFKFDAHITSVERLPDFPRAGDIYIQRFGCESSGSLDDRLYHLSLHL